jgi:hypothetical protein
VKQQPAAWNLDDKPAEKSKKPGAAKDEEDDILIPQQINKDSHKGGEISDSQPSQDASKNGERKSQGDNKDGDKSAANQIVNQPPYYQPFQNPMQVPLNGALRSINNIMLTQ